MRCVNRQDCRNSSSSRRRILTRPLARWRERIVQTLTCSRPPTTIEKLSLTPRAARPFRSQLVQLTPPNLDEAACSLARENRPNAHLLAASYDNRKIIAYTESRPDVLPSGALRLLRDPGVRQFAVGSCYARNAAYPTGMYWVAILLY